MAPRIARVLKPLAGGPQNASVPIPCDDDSAFLILRLRAENALLASPNVLYFVHV